MNLHYSLAFCTIALGACSFNDDSQLSSNEQAHEAVCIARGFDFTEGPTADEHGNVYFTDQPNNTIFRYSIEGKLDTITKSSGRSNGLYAPGDGYIYACADMNNNIIRFKPNGAAEIFWKEDSALFNGPNDLWIDKDNAIYFTDPLYLRNYWTRDTTSQRPEGLYYLAPGHKKAVLLDSLYVQPNGITASPDGRILYVADIEAGIVWQYPIIESGKLGARTKFIKKGSDGMITDSEGNVYITGNGVDGYTPDGEHFIHIHVPEDWTANICIGGVNKDLFFITASHGLYTFPLADIKNAH